MTSVDLICSNRRRATVHSGRRFGNQHWARDVFHATKDGAKTLCGVSAEGWLLIGHREITATKTIQTFASSVRHNSNGRGAKKAADTMLVAVQATALTVRIVDTP